MQTAAVVMTEPGRVGLDLVEIKAAASGDAVVEVAWSGISAGTERLLWLGRMPHFPGMGYPLVPGYESVGEVVEADSRSGLAVGDWVFVPGAACYTSARALFGATARRLVIPGARAVPLGAAPDADATLLSLAATAYHAMGAQGASRPDLIIGHGVLGRLLARLAMIGSDSRPVVWERDASRRSGANGYTVVAPEDDDRRDYRCICDVSGDATILDAVMPRLAFGGEIVLAGFYSAPLSFVFPPAFMREARMRIAAQFLPGDLIAVRDLVRSGALSLDGLITHRHTVDGAGEAYRTAFEDAQCLKMVLDWRQYS